MKISVVINTLNEEKNLPKALSSVKKIADEIIVVDMYSDDATQEIAKKFGAKVYEHKRMGYVEPARNYALSKATGDWILVLDADEELTPRLAEKLIEVTAKGKIDYLAIPRQNIIFGKWMKHSRFWPDYNIRFFKNGHVAWNSTIHSVPFTTGQGTDLPAEESFALKHYHYDSIEQFVERMNRYSTHQAKNFVKENNAFSASDLITKPVNEFLSRYFHGEGYKDGIHGLALAGLQAFSEFVMYLKVWQLMDFKTKNLSTREVIGLFKKSSKDASYWYADTLYKLGGGLKERVKRKLRIS